MSRLFIPLILMAAAVGLFIFYTNPTYQASKTLAAQASSYNEALSKAQELRATRDSLLSKRNTFSTEDVTKLQHVLPDNIDNIRLIIDINNIASRHNLTLSGVQLGTISNSGSAQSSAAVGSSGDPIGSVQVGFSVSTDYNTFLAFLQDLEHSMRVVDVTNISFTPAAGDITSFTLQIRTYWLH